MKLKRQHFVFDVFSSPQSAGVQRHQYLDGSHLGVPCIAVAANTGNPPKIDTYDTN